MIRNHMRDGMLGLAIGDAMGVPVEFAPRKRRMKDPVTGMRGFGTHSVPPGTWSDDTSMALATLASLKQGIDFDDVMNRFLAWLNEAAYTATDKVFDVGISTRIALAAYAEGTDALNCGGKDDWDNGNGSLMRILPGSIYAAQKMPGADIHQKMKLIANLSRLTHRHPRSIAGCQIFTFLVWALMENPSADAIAQGLTDAQAFFADGHNPEFAAFSRLMDPEFRHLPESEISSSGYIVHTLEAAVWCLLNSSNFADCVLTAVNLGSDTDTVGAIAGALAGLIYGADAIPEEWMTTLKRADRIQELCEDFAGC